MIQQQLQLMAEQLRLLGGAAAGPAAVLPASLSAHAAAPPRRAGFAGCASAESAGAAQRRSTISEDKPHPAFKPIDRSADESVARTACRARRSGRRRYTRRTAESKRLAAESRPVLADPRSRDGVQPALEGDGLPDRHDRSDGSKIWDVDGNEYVDLRWGFGVAPVRPPPAIRGARPLQRAAGRGLRDRPACRPWPVKSRRWCAS